MRALILVAGATLAVAACGTNEPAVENDTMAVDNLVVDNLMVNDTTSIDATNMTDDMMMDINTVEGDTTNAM